ncbi:beta-galactoside alpha-2,6-sialyltransferase 2 [Dunckerocampus dactyliophorus]|uniref:beta-galactoside alpha-2,6-sialyltransferase 2 n=1 Tax=Dunckerocampus dactyliophorus TaxID=161453 RepID=UPI002404FF2C|nr:beta-galactoside alpha-2,6-sialyltransferase 2 [Dunckerocampus dactyliophorus]
MKSSMWQWRRLVLVGMLAWVLFFLALFSYFLDAGPLLTQHPDTRRLASIQQNSLTGSRPELAPSLTPTYPGDGPGLEAHSSSVTPGSSVEVSRSPNSALDANYGSQETSRQDSLDPQTLAAWSSFGTENVGSHSSRDRTSRTTEYQNHVKKVHNQGGEEEEEDADEERGNRMRTLRGAADASSDLEESYSSKSALAAKRLWQGLMSSSTLKQVRNEYLNANKYHVAFKGPRRTSQSAKELLCQMKAQAPLSTVDGSEQPFSSFGWADLVPSLTLEQLYRTQGRSSFRTCAVVSSAGAILRSGLGKEIDAHDAVLRFNAAPTEGYERDVGSKTTIRIINSQILAKTKFQFKTSSLYKNVTLVAWDPAPYDLNLHKWYASPDYDLFGPYVEHRKHYPGQPFYILHPSYIWGLWDVIQGNTQENIQPNPPSSGFLGILLMMALCEQVHVYKYIPSARQTDLCHYHELYHDIACTLGAYHPLLFEKNLVLRINTGTEGDLKKGRVTLPGFRTVDCDI